MMRMFALLKGYVVQFLLLWTSWRAFAVTLTAGQVVPPLIGLAVWSSATGGDHRVAGYYAALMLVKLLTVSYENHTFSERIYAGDLADCLLRPHPVVLEPLGENIAIRIWHVVIGLPLVGLILWYTHTPLDAGSFAVAIPAVVLAAALRFAFTYLLALSAFWTQRAHGVVGLGNTLVFLLGGEAAPLAFMPVGAAKVLAWLPFAPMNAFPAEVASGLASGGSLLDGCLLQAAWLGFMVLACSLVWRLGVNRYTAVGG